MKMSIGNLMEMLEEETGCKVVSLTDENSLYGEKGAILFDKAEAFSFVPIMCKGDLIWWWNQDKEKIEINIYDPESIEKLVDALKNDEIYWQHDKTEWSNFYNGW